MSRDGSSIAKISRPKLSRVFRRQRLFKLLDAGRKKPVTWISGPAGSGKTTLAASYLDHRKLPCIWYSVDGGDSDLAGFFYYMGLAARTAAPRFRKSLPLLTPEYLPSLPVFTRRYFEDLCARLKPPFTIVLDNYQDVPPGSPFSELLASGIAALPQGITMIVISRTGSPAAFARLRASEQISVIASNVLWFTEDEARGILRSKGRRATPDNLRSLLDKTRGWAAGLVLLTKSPEAAAEALWSGNSFATEEVFDYFAGEVINGLDNETRDFLLKTSFLPTMTVRTAAELSGRENAGSILSGLHANNFFTERHAGPEAVYQYHTLFRECLMSRMKESLNAEGIVRLQKRAAALVASEGRVEDAVSLYRDSGDWESLVPLILNHAQTLVSRGRAKTLLEWLLGIPEALRERTPWLLYWMGVCSVSYRPSESRAWFERAFLLFDSQGNDAGALLAWSGVVQTYLLEFHDFRPLDRWIAWLDGRSRQAVSYPSPEIEASVASGMTGALLWRNPGHRNMKEWADRALSLSRTSLHIDTWLRANTNSAIYAVWMGEFARCADLIGEMRAAVPGQSSAPLRLIALKNTEAMLYNSSADFRGLAIRSVTEGLALARETGIHLMDPLLLLQGVCSALNDGDGERLRDFLAHMEPVLGTGSRTHAAHYYYFAAWRHLLSGQQAQALAAVQKSLDLVQEAGVPFSETLIRLALALVLDEAGDRQQARLQLAEGGAMLAQTKSAYFEYLYRLTEAYFALDRPDPGPAREALRKAMETGKRMGFTTMIYYWRPAILSRLCAEAMEAGLEVAYAQDLVRKLGLVPELTAEKLDNWPWPLKIYTLGTFRIEKEGKPLVFAGKVQQKPLEMLKVLVAFGGSGVSDDRIMEALWPDAEGDDAFQSYETTLHRLRKLLGIEKAVVRSEGRISLDPALCWVDATAFERLLWEAESRGPAENNGGAGGPVLDLLEKALSLYRGNFLGGEKELPWLLSPRERLRSRFLRAVARAGALLEQAGQWEATIVQYRKALEIDDLAEEFYQRLMVCYSRQGRRADAVAVYERCRKILFLTIGVEPSAGTTALYEEILRRS